MKRKTDDIYNLIQSLDKTEKGYFKKFAQRNDAGGEKNYIRLFNIIDGLVVSGKEYEERQVRNKYKGEKFLHHLSFTKTYLYNLLLKSLSSYDSGKFIGSQINELMDNILVLFRRGLYSQSLKFIKRAKKFAYQNEQYIKLYDILRYEKNVYIRLAPKNYKILINKIYAEQINVLDMIRNFTDYGRLYSESFDTLDDFGLFLNPESERKFDGIMKNKLMSSDSFANSFQAKLFFYGIIYAYYIAKYDFENAYRAIKKQIEIQNSNLFFKKNFPFSYWVEYLNLIELVIFLRKNKEAVELFVLAEKTIADKNNNLSKANRVYFKEMLLTSKLAFYIRNWNPQRVAELAEEVMQNNKISNEISEKRLNSAYFYIAQYYFIMRKYDSSLGWLNKINIEHQDNWYLNYFSSVPILNILIHYELGNYERIEYLIQSVKRYLNKNKIHYKLESEFLKTMKKLAACGEDNVRIEILKLFKKNIEGFSKDSMFYNLDLISWVDSKIRQENLSDILTRKAAISLI